MGIPTPPAVRVPAMLPMGRAMSMPVRFLFSLDTTTGAAVAMELLLG